MHCRGVFFCLFGLLFSTAIAWPKDLTEQSALDFLATPHDVRALVNSTLLPVALWNSWTRVVEQIVNRTIGDQEAVQILKRHVAFLEGNVASLKNLISQPRDASLVQDLSHDLSTLPRVTPSFRWAQSNSTLYIQVKLSLRWSSPGALSVRHENISIDAFSFRFSGIGTHSTVKKLYELHLPFYDTIVPDNSTFLWGSVGKLSITLQKQRDAPWPRLLNSTAKIPNMHIWHEMQDTLRLDSNDLRPSNPPNTTTPSTDSSLLTPFMKKEEL